MVSTSLAPRSAGSHRVEDRLEPLPLRARHLAGRQPGADRLDLLHGLEQLGQPGRLQARDDRAAMRPQLDQIHGRQLLERLAHRRARHGEALRHRHLVEPLPRRQLAAHDRLGDGVPQRIGPCAPRLDRPGPDLFQNRSPARGKPGLCRRVAGGVNGGGGHSMLRTLPSREARPSPRSRATPSPDPRRPLSTPRPATPGLRCRGRPPCRRPAVPAACRTVPSARRPCGR